MVRWGAMVLFPVYMSFAADTLLLVTGLWFLGITTSMFTQVGWGFGFKTLNLGVGGGGGGGGKE
jgi:hypothetical protein